MKSKSYVLTVGGHEGVKVDAEAEGDHRYMVRMALPDQSWHVRVGCLTGVDHRWVAEFYTGEDLHPTRTFRSAKAACMALAESTMAGFACPKGLQSIDELFRHEVMLGSVDEYRSQSCRVFKCLAIDPDHAEDLAVAANPGLKVWQIAGLDDYEKNLMLFSFDEFIARDGAGFWSLAQGWVMKEQATRFSEFDSLYFADSTPCIGNYSVFVGDDDPAIPQTTPAICFLFCPNGKAWRLRPGYRIAGTVQIGELDESDLDSFLHTVAEYATGSASGLVDFSYKKLGNGQVSFDGIAGDLDDEDEATEYRILLADDPELQPALIAQYNLADFEVEHALASLSKEYCDECCVQIAGSAREIRTPKHPEPCNYVRIVQDSLELFYWCCDEWMDAPEGVMSAIIGEVAR